MKKPAKNIIPILSAIAAAAFYALSIPFSKLLLSHAPPLMTASFLYFGAGIGIAVMYAAAPKSVKTQQQRLTRSDLSYTLLMIILDIAAPICLMLGLTYACAANVSLLGNFEIVATSVIALALFGEKISGRLWSAIALITLSSIILSFQGASGLSFSAGSLFVAAACLCWGFENNCTRKISGKSTYEIVILKGIFSGIGSLIVALIAGEGLPQAAYILLTMLLGFVAYGLSIFVYIRAQKELGAAKTSAYYAVSPFIGAFLSFIVLSEPLTPTFFVALLIMLAGTALVVCDTLYTRHKHLHTHTITHTHDGSTHTHVIEHSHYHSHGEDVRQHTHKHLSV